MDLKTVDHLLTTTRSVRKRLDLTRPVEPAVLEKCIEIAFQAPTGGNSQNWHFMLVTDPQKKAAIADYYRKGIEIYMKQQRYEYAPNDPRAAQMPRVLASAMHLIEHLHEVPVHVLACIEGRAEQEGVFAQASLYGSILPAVWSFMLALRSRGIGSAWTTLHLFFEKETSQLLGIPATVTQAVLLPVAYFTGDDFQPAKRLPARQSIHWNTWGHRQ